MSTVTCVSGVDLLMDYLEDALPAAVRAAVDEHVAGCPKCVAFLASYRETPRILRDATLVSLPADLQAALAAAVRGRLGG
jgi:anti-sigma factor RsiW